VKEKSIGKASKDNFRSRLPSSKAGSAEKRIDTPYNRNKITQGLNFQDQEKCAAFVIHPISVDKNNNPR
jgi:hypothetical protein